jgi:hypothetical protein
LAPVLVYEVSRSSCLSLILGNYDREEQLITDTFEPRRQAIIQQCEEVDRVYRRDKYTDDDYEGLKCLLRPNVSRGVMNIVA